MPNHSTKATPTCQGARAIVNKSFHSAHFRKSYPHRDRSFKALRASESEHASSEDDVLEAPAIVTPTIETIEEVRRSLPSSYILSAFECHVADNYLLPSFRLQPQPLLPLPLPNQC